jgi:hypothetical protein
MAGTTNILYGNTDFQYSKIFKLGTEPNIQKYNKEL